MVNNYKELLRKSLLELLRTQKEDVRFKKSKLIANKLFKMQEFISARAIMFYCSFDGEVETFSMIQEAQRLGKKVVLPITIKKENKIIPSVINNIENDLLKGPYGILQPKEDACRDFDLKDLGLVIVPGLGFDQKNNRLGRGKGYYDRFLKILPESTPTIGLAFDFQVLSSLPLIEDHDVPVSCVLTN